MPECRGGRRGEYVLATGYQEISLADQRQLKHAMAFLVCHDFMYVD